MYSNFLQLYLMTGCYEDKVSERGHVFSYLSAVSFSIVIQEKFSYNCMA